MTERVIVIEGLRKAYGEVEAVRGIDLHVDHGEVFALLGPNGAGKTTTTEILEGYRPRDGGEVSVLGHDPARGDRELKRRGRRYVLSRAYDVSATAVPVDEGRALVRLEADLSNLRTGRLAGAGASTAVGLAAGGTLLALGFFPSLPSRPCSWAASRAMAWRAAIAASPRALSSRSSRCSIVSNRGNLRSHARSGRRSKRSWTARREACFVRRVRPRAGPYSTAPIASSAIRHPPSAISRFSVHGIDLYRRRPRRRAHGQRHCAGRRSGRLHHQGSRGLRPPLSARARRDREVAGEGRRARKSDSRTTRPDARPTHLHDDRCRPSRLRHRHRGRGGGPRRQERAAGRSSTLSARPTRSSLPIRRASPSPRWPRPPRDPIAWSACTSSIPCR